MGGERWEWGVRVRVGWYGSVGVWEYGIVEVIGRTMEEGFTLSPGHLATREAGLWIQVDTKGCSAAMVIRF